MSQKKTEITDTKMQVQQFRDIRNVYKILNLAFSQQLDILLFYLSFDNCKTEIKWAR